MGLLYESMRQYIWEHGWRPFWMVEKGRKVLAWRQKEHGRECQDIQDAYHITKLNVGVTGLWR